MGNWRRVWITGTIPQAEVEGLREALAPDWREYDDDTEWPGAHCLLVGESLCGLGNWPAPVVNAVRNLYERNYTPDDVLHACAAHVLVHAPGARLKIHCGDDYERPKCVATVTAENGRAVLGPPEVETLPEIPEEVIQARVYSVVFGSMREV